MLSIAVGQVSANVSRERYLSRQRESLSPARKFRASAILISAKVKRETEARNHSAKLQRESLTPARFYPTARKFDASAKVSRERDFHQILSPARKFRAIVFGNSAKVSDVGDA